MPHGVLRAAAYNIIMKPGRQPLGLLRSQSHRQHSVSDRRRSARGLGAGKEIGEGVVDAGDAEVGLAAEGFAHVVDAVGVVGQKLDDGEAVVLGLVERVEDLVAGHGDGWGAMHAALDLDEAQLAGAGDAALEVVAEVLELAVGGLEARARSVCMTMARVRAAAS